MNPDVTIRLIELNDPYWQVSFETWKEIYSIFVDGKYLDEASDLVSKVSIKDARGLWVYLVEECKGVPTA